MNKNISEYTKDIRVLSHDLRSDVKRSTNLLDLFCDDPNDQSLMQSWYALEIITKKLEEIQSKLIKISF